MNVSRFFLIQTNSDFLFYYLPVSNEKAEILSLATASNSIYAASLIKLFALLISMARFKSINFD